MPKYIDADEYKKKLRKRQKVGTISRNVLIIEFRAINEMPSADVTEVIRCKDCRRYITEGSFCSCFDGLMRAKPNNYCSYAERKESKVKKCFDISKEVAEKLLEDTERKETDA